MNDVIVTCYREGDDPNQPPSYQATFSNERYGVLRILLLSAGHMMPPLRTYTRTKEGRKRGRVLDAGLRLLELVTGREWDQSEIEQSQVCCLLYQSPNHVDHCDGICMQCYE